MVGKFWLSQAYHAARPLNHDLIVERIKATKLEPAFEGQAIAFVGRLEKGPRDEPKTIRSQASG
jgi:hypothetical protein